LHWDTQEVIGFFIINANQWRKHVGRDKNFFIFKKLRKYTLEVEETDKKKIILPNFFYFGRWKVGFEKYKKLI